MPNVITQLSDESFEVFLSQINASDMIDLRDVTFIDPYGMVGILEAGRLFSRQGIMKTLLLPESDYVLRYLERMNFFKYAGGFLTWTLKIFICPTNI